MESPGSVEPETMESFSQGSLIELTGNSYWLDNVLTIETTLQTTQKESILTGCTTDPDLPYWLVHGKI